MFHESYCRVFSQPNRVLRQAQGVCDALVYRQADASRDRAFCGSVAKRVVLFALGNPKQPHQPQTGRGDCRGVPASHNTTPRESYYPQLWQPPNRVERNFAVHPAVISGTVIAAPQQAIAAAVRVQQQLTQQTHFGTGVGQYCLENQGSLQHTSGFGPNFPAGQMHQRNGAPHQIFPPYSSAPHGQYPDSYASPWGTTAHGSNQQSPWQHNRVARGQRGSESTYIDLTFKGRER